MQGLKQSDLCIKALLSENVDHILSEPLMPAERDIGVYEVAKMGQKLIGNLGVTSTGSSSFSRRQ